MSKKLINNPESVVDEALAGLVAVHPGLQLLEGHRVVVRADIETVIKEGKVTLLSGGGSGHEPAHAGYVGRGMLSVAVAGAVFASPSPASILAALRAVRSPGGTLMIVKNYTGDRLNFGIALERARSEGMKVTMVIVGEDCALPSTGKAAGRRGLCGTILVHKVGESPGNEATPCYQHSLTANLPTVGLILRLSLRAFVFGGKPGNEIAGALAEKGCSLDEVTSAAQEVADNIATMSVSLSSCSVPGHKPNFTLGEDEMELGLGIHGEAGAERAKLQPADTVVERMLTHMTSQEPGYRYFNIDPGMKVVLVVNNLGGTSNLELSIMANAAIRHLVDKAQAKVTRVYVGSLMTSMEMAGVSLTLLKVSSDSWEKYLNLPTTAFGWPSVSVVPHGEKVMVDSTPISCQSSQTRSELKDTGDPTTSTGQILKRCVEKICAVLIARKEELNELDRGGGDGDCGNTLKAGADAIRKKIPSIVWDDPKKALLSLAEQVENHMGGTSGAIYNLFLSAGAATLAEPSQPLSWAQALQEGMKAIMKCGGANIGDRTMLDALNPAVTVLMRDLPESTTREKAVETLKAAVEAAKVGTAATVGMVAQAGRASNVHVSQLTRPDPGAHAVALWLEAVYEAVYEE